MSESLSSDLSITNLLANFDITDVTLADQSLAEIQTRVEQQTSSKTQSINEAEINLVIELGKDLFKDFVPDNLEKFAIHYKYLTERVGETDDSTTNGSEETLEPHSTLTNDSGDMVEPHSTSTNGSGDMVEPHSASTNGSGDMVEPHSASTNGSGDIGEPHSTLTNCRNPNFPEDLYKVFITYDRKLKVKAKNLTNGMKDEINECKRTLQVGT